MFKPRGRAYDVIVQQSCGIKSKGGVGIERSSSDASLQVWTANLDYGSENIKKLSSLLDAALAPVPIASLQHTPL